tara:strand:- start:143 stop:349 length:207 start_codon:yes stop_codon:yes gene_type:complete
MRTYYLLSLRERERKKLLGVLNEKLSADATQKDYIDDFLDSDAPQFKGKSKKKIIGMAVAAYRGRKNG